MNISYDVFTDAFLSKITEFEFIQIPEEGRTEIIDGYMKRAISAFQKICKYDLSERDDGLREFSEDFSDSDIDEITDIVSEGMVVQWLKPYLYKQELLENALNTKDFSTYSPAELLLRVGNAYDKAQKDYTQMVREYSFNHGDLTDLHL
nr:MAG TPA: hypothetical protein [Caudoviricetes sp.]